MENQPLTAKAVFDQALEIASPAERRAYVDDACAADQELKQKVESLLRAYEDAGSFLESPPPELAATVVPSISEGTGSRIGPYKLLQQLGEGGMGVVYMAEQQEPVRRRVALKIIKPGMDSQQVIARFEAERQALAIMDHQNIARVLDAGTTEQGRPYFVMELVHGVPITKYCDDNHLPPRQRLELVVPVCQAIQHAHQKGVIHRDVKPSNVMVCLYDGKPVPKVIDFGVAKAVEQRLTERTLFTQYGALVGTFEYMSPEQAEMSQLGIDTRSDIYSLGVLIYELLTGDTPLTRQRLRDSAFAEVLRLIREEEPPKPSTRLSTTGAALATISAQRHTEPAKLTKLMRGELDWIVMKALEKDRTRRYDSASGLAKDIERYLDDEPVEACPPTAAYRLHKLARKHRNLLSTIAALALVLLLGVVLSTWQALRARRAEADAMMQRDVALQNQEQAEAARQSEAQAKDVAQAMALEQLKLTRNAVVALDDARKSKDEAEQERNNVAEANQQLKKTTDNLNRNLYFSRIALADREFFANNVDRARELLYKCPPELRHWEWDYLHRLCHGELLTLPFPGKPVTVAFSPDGGRLALGGGEFNISGELKIYDANTGKELLNPAGHANRVIGVVFTPDGKQLISAGLDKAVKFWDARTGNELKALEAAADVLRIAVSPDGKFLAAALADKTVVLWNAATAQPVRTLSKVKLLVGIAFSPDSKELAFVSAENAIRFHDLASGEEREISLGEHSGAFLSLAFSRDGQRLVAASSNVVVVFDLVAGKIIRTIPGTVLNAADNVFVSPGGQRLAVAAHDKSIQIWDAEAVRKLVTLRGHSGVLLSVTFSPDGTRLASTSLDKTVKVWDAHQEPEVRLLTVAKATTFSVAFSPDGRQLAVGRGAELQNFQLQRLGHVLLIDVKTGNEIKRLGNTLLPYASVGFSPDGKRIAGVTNFVSFGDDAKGPAALGVKEGTLNIWDLDSGKEAFKFGADFGPSPRLAFAPDPKNQLLAVAGGNIKKPELRIWNTASSTLVKTLPLASGPIAAVAFSGDGRLLAAGGGEPGKPADVKVWDVQTWQELHTLAGHADAVSAIAFNPHVPQVATGSYDRFVRIWNAVKGSEVLEVGPHPHGISCVAYSPDGRRLAVGGQDTVKLWDTQTGDEALTLSRPPGKAIIISLAFSPDGRQIAAADVNGAVILWDAGSPDKRLESTASPVVP